MTTQIRNNNSLLEGGLLFLALGFVLSFPFHPSWVGATFMLSKIQASGLRITFLILLTGIAAIVLNKFNAKWSEWLGALCLYLFFFVPAMLVFSIVPKGLPWMAPVIMFIGIQMILASVSVMISQSILQEAIRGTDSMIGSILNKKRK